MIGPANMEIPLSLVAAAEETDRQTSKVKGKKKVMDMM